MAYNYQFAKTQKGRDALIAFSYEAASEWKPQST